MSKIKVGVCGGTGYSGIELLNILKNHKDAEIIYLTSESQVGKTVGEILPGLVDFADYTYLSLKDERVYQNVDVVFLCLPHEPCAVTAKSFLDKGIKVIDLSGAHRIKDLDVFERDYGFKHPHPELVKEAVFGLPEINGEQVKTARLIANPGCYPTSVLIPVVPLFKEGILSPDSVIIDSKSGFSGRGKRLDLDGLFVEQNENFYAYGIGKHRHQAEIAQELTLAAGNNVPTLFSPHVLPLERGILSTIYIKADNIKDKVLSYLNDFYQDKPFVKIFDDRLPKLKWVARTNRVYIGAEYAETTGHLAIVSVIDNLVKGASGQAVQNMNLMFGTDETEGLC